jgi:ferredoxin-NADP reductase
MTTVASGPGHLGGSTWTSGSWLTRATGAERSFSIASPPEDSRIALTIERLPGAKVSSRLCEEVQPGF